MVPHHPLARESQLLDVTEEAEHALLERCRGAFVIIAASTSDSSISRLSRFAILELPLTTRRDEKLGLEDYQTE
jgi:hypothetical protein